jgi:hypothetical protein
MNPTPALAAFALMCLLCTAAHANDAAEAAVAGQRPEAKVQRTVVEDDATRIEELRVRGELRSVTVQPKGAIRRGYEILPPDGARDMSESAGSGRGAAGKRVWRVLNF